MRSKWIVGLVALVILVALAVPAAAQGPSTGDQSNAPIVASAGQFWFLGNVREQVTNAPVQGWMTLRAFDATRGTYVPVVAGPVDSTGAYQLNYFGSATQFLLILDAPEGYFPNPGGIFFTEPGPGIYQHDFTVKKTAVTFTIAGHVYRSGTTTGVAGANVTLLQYNRTSLAFDIYQTLTTGADGAYSFTYIGTTGRFMVEVGAPGGFVPTLQSDQVWGALGYPLPAKNFFVKPAPISETFNGVVRVQGTSIGVGGAGVELLQWSDTDCKFTSVTTTTTASDGSFGLPYNGNASMFRVVVTAPAGYGPATQSQDVTVNLGDTPPFLTFYLIPNARTLAFKGVVYLTATTTGVPGVWITLRAFDASQGKFVAAGAQQTDNQGFFNLPYTGTAVQFQLIAQASSPWSPASQQVDLTVTVGHTPPDTTFFVNGPIPQPTFNVYMLCNSCGGGVPGGWITLRAWNGSAYVAVAAAPTGTNGLAVLQYTGMATKFRIIAQAPAGYTPALQTQDVTLPFGTRPAPIKFYVTK